MSLEARQALAGPLAGTRQEASSRRIDVHPDSLLGVLQQQHRRTEESQQLVTIQAFPEPAPILETASLERPIVTDPQPEEIQPIVIGSGIFGQERRNTNLARVKHGGMKIATYTISRDDGSTTVYIQSSEGVVFQEEWSAPEGKNGKQQLIGRAEIGGRAEAGIVQSEIDGKEGKPVLLVYSHDQANILKERELEEQNQREERQKEVLEAAGKVIYVPTPNDNVIHEHAVNQLHAILARTKETLSEHAVQTAKLLALSGTTSFLVWGPSFLPGGQIFLATAVSLWGSSRVNPGGQSMRAQFDTISYVLGGYALGSLLPIPGGSIVGAAIGFGVDRLAKKIGKARALKKLAKAHPEIVNDADLQTLYEEENNGNVMRDQMRLNQLKVQEQKQAQLRRSGQEEHTQSFLAEHATTVEQLRKELPTITDSELVGAVEYLQSEYRANNPALEYISKATKGMQRRIFIPAALMYGVYGLRGLAGQVFNKIPVPAIVGIYTAWNAIVNPFILYKKVNEVKKEIINNNPELLQASSKHHSKQTLLSQAAE